jgi:DNA-binding transcriptional ArsR family regulator
MHSDTTAKRREGDEMMKDMGDMAMEEIARYFGALAVSTRLKILNALRDGERSVGELTTFTGSTQANVSKHLAVLARNGMVGKSARGTSVFYRIVDARIYRLCDLVCGQIGRRCGEQAEWQRSFIATARPARGVRARSARRQ